MGEILIILWLGHSETKLDNHCYTYLHMSQINFLLLLPCSSNIPFWGNWEFKILMESFSYLYKMTWFSDNHGKIIIKIKIKTILYTRYLKIFKVFRIVRNCDLKPNEEKDCDSHVWDQFWTASAHTLWRSSGRRALLRACGRLGRWRSDGPPHCVLLIEGNLQENSALCLSWTCTPELLERVKYLNSGYLVHNE